MVFKLPYIAMARCHNRTKQGRRCKAKTTTGLCSIHRVRRIKYEIEKIIQVVLHMFNRDPETPTVQYMDTVYALAGLSHLTPNEVHDLLRVCLTLLDRRRNQ